MALEAGPRPSAAVGAPLVRLLHAGVPAANWDTLQWECAAMNVQHLAQQRQQEPAVESGKAGQAAIKRPADCATIVPFSLFPLFPSLLLCCWLRSVQQRIVSLAAMDFKGQKLSEQLSMLIVSVFAAAAFVAGYLLENFNLMMSIFLTGSGLALVACVPDWPIYNRHPVTWLPPREAGGGESGAAGKQQRRKPARSPSNLWGFL